MPAGPTPHAVIWNCCMQCKTGNATLCQIAPKLGGLALRGLLGSGKIQACPGKIPLAPWRPLKSTNYTKKLVCRFCLSKSHAAAAVVPSWAVLPACKSARPAKNVACRAGSAKIAINCAKDKPFTLNLIKVIQKRLQLRDVGALLMGVSCGVAASPWCSCGGSSVV